MIRRWARRLLLTAAGLAALVALAHTPVVRAWVLQYGSAAIGRRTGLTISASSLSYNLFTHEVAIDGLVVATDAAAPPLVRIGRAKVVLTTWLITGLPAIESIDAEGVAVRVDLDIPRTTAAPFSIPGFRVGRASLKHVDVEVTSRSGFGVVSIRGATFDLRGGQPASLAGSFTVTGGIALDNDDLRLRVDRADGRLAIAGPVFTLQPSAIEVGGERFTASGTIRAGGDAAGYDATLAGRVLATAIGDWFPSWPAMRGTVDLSARVTGPLAQPRVAFTAKTPGIDWPAFRLPPTSATGNLSREGVRVENLSAAVGAGTLSARGFVSFSDTGDPSRVTLSASAIPTSAVQRAFPTQRAHSQALSLTGSGELAWPGLVPTLASLAGRVSAEVAFAEGVPPVRATAVGAAGSWQLRAGHEWDASTRADLASTIAFDDTDAARSRIDGHLDLSSADAVDLFARIRTLVPDLPATPAWLELGPLALNATLSGTVAEPRAAGTLTGSGIAVQGAGPLSLTAAFDAGFDRVTVSRAAVADGHGNRAEATGVLDLARGETEGTLSATLRNPAALVGADTDTLRLTGAVAADGSWKGPLSDPSLTLHAQAADAAISTAFVAASHVGLDASLEGPVSKLRASISARTADLRAGAYALGAATVDATMADGRVRVDASVPTLSATLRAEGSSSLPPGGTIEVSIDGADLRQLGIAADAAGRRIEGAGTVTARVEASVDGTSRTVTTSGLATLADGAVLLDGASIAQDLAARVEFNRGRLDLAPLSGSLLDGPLDATASLPLDWLGSLLPAGWRLVTPAPVTPARAEVRAAPTLAALAQALGGAGLGDAQVPMPVPIQITLESATPELRALVGRASVGPATVQSGDVSFAMPAPAEFRLADGILTARPVKITGPATSATLAGTLRLDGARDISADIDASGSLRFLSVLLPGRVAGSFAARLRLAGPMADPGVTGTISMNQGLWIWPAQRLALTEWTGDCVLDAKTIEVRGLRGQVNGGDAELSGSMEVGAAPSGAARPGLTLRVKDAFLEVVPGLTTQLDADLVLTAATQGARLAGTITATAGSYREPVLAMAKLLAPSPRRPAAARGSRAGASTGPGILASIALDIRLAATSPIIVENSAGRVDLLPDLRLGGTAEAPTLSGALAALDDGRLMLAGRTYRLGGRVVFAPGASAPRIELVGETQIGAYAVTLRTDGYADELEMSYTSDPPLGERDIRSLLVTGRVADAAGSSSADDDRFAIGAASSDLLGIAGQMVGLDSVQLGRGDFELGSNDVNPAMRLTVTKSLGTRFQVVLSQNLDDNKFTWIVIYDSRRGYQFRFSQRDNQEEVVEFRHEIEFGPGVSRAQPARGAARAPLAIVSAVTFSGTPGVAEGDLRSVLMLRPGRPFDLRAWQRDQARLVQLYRDRGFETALVVPSRLVTAAAAQQIALGYRIEPGPRTMLRITGVDASPDLNRALMRVWGRSVLPEFVREDLQRFMRQHLADRGYLRPLVEVQIQEPDESVALAVIAVTPGPLTAARHVAFSGNRAVTEPELRARLTEAGVLGRVWTDPASAEVAIVELYAERGYLAAAAHAEPVSFDGDRAELLVRITEGPAAAVAAVRLTGVPAARDAEVRAAALMRNGQPYLPGAERDAARRVERHYQLQGYLGAQAEPTLAFDEMSRVTVTLAITEGPRSVVRAVNVSGAESTNRGLVDDAITITPGSPATPSSAAETQRRLYGIGVFRRAEVRFEPVVPPTGATSTAPRSADVSVDAAISLQETRRFLLRYGVQLSNQYGSFTNDPTGAIGVSGDISDRNFLGRAFTVGASGRIEKNLKSLRGLFALPRMFDQRLQSTAYATWRIEKESLGDDIWFQQRERNLSLEQRWRLSRRMDISWGYTFSRQFGEFLVPTVADVPLLGGTLASLNGTFVLDTRDSSFDATRGVFQSTNLQWGLEPLGSEFGYVRVLLRQFYYQRAGPLVFASGARWGKLKGLGGSPPLNVVDLLFEAGGSQTVRGYAENSLSAIEIIGVPVGGSEVLLLNQEVRFPIWGWVRGAAFFDAGNTFSVLQPLSLNRLALGAGWGLRIHTPIAPLRIDIGWPINPRRGDKRYRLYFSIGQIF